MRKFMKNTFTTIAACFVVVASASVANEGLIPTPETDTDIIVDTDYSFEEEEGDALEVQSLADEPDRDEKE